MKGWRTFGYGLAVATIPPAVTYLGHVEWTTLGISPVMAALIGGGIMVLRAVTDSALGKK